MYKASLDQLTIYSDQLDLERQAQPSLELIQKDTAEHPRVISLEAAAQHIGALLSPYAFEDNAAPLMAVTPDDFENALPSSIGRGLVFAHGLNRLSNPTQVVRIFDGMTELTEPGVQASHIGVAFHENEHHRLAHSVRYLGEHSSATTLAANPLSTNSALEHTERQRRSGSSMAKTFASKVKSIDNFTSELEHRRSVFDQVYRGMRNQPPVRYLPENAFKLLLQADQQLRDILQTSMANRPNSDGTYRALTPNEQAGAMRALTVNLWQRPNTAKIWKNYALLGTRYIGAQRGKLDESRKQTVAGYLAKRKFIKDNEQAEFDAIVFPGT